MANISHQISSARKAFTSGISKNVSFRKEQLEALYLFLQENESLIMSALKQDLGKPYFETKVSEIDFVMNDIRGALYNIDEYVKRHGVDKSLVTIVDDSFIQYEPYGCVLIIGAWNYPIQVALSPMVGAIAAGNTVLLKPSEIAPVTAQLLADLLPSYLHRECYHVVLGDASITQQLLNQKFDYIFFTGSNRIGKLIHESAAKHLTPTTLELGGKSPLYIDDSVPDLEVACRRILWGKFINAGQTCVAPDYILCNPELEKQLIVNLKKIIKEFYGDNPLESENFARIVSQRHFDRLNKLLSCGKVAIGGQIDRDKKYISPTVLVNVSPDDIIMKEEIFGPILPIINVKDADEAIDFINARDKPLTLYIFSTRKHVIDQFIEHTSSGSVCANDAVVHLTVDSLPFGGVGESGFGAYHGKFSFETFSHAKAVLVRGWNPLIEWVGSKRYPPYSQNKLNRLLRLIKKRKSYLPAHSMYFVMLLIGFTAGFIYKQASSNLFGI